MQAVLAVIPIALILVLMVGRRWSAARAGAAGYLSALLIAALFFGAGPTLLAYAHAKAFLLSLDVLLIIWAAFLHYLVVEEAGAIGDISQALPRLTTDQTLQALVIGWVFASFLQSVGGFGVPVAVIAPILIGLGFGPLEAVLIPCLGHGWSVTFGSLGLAFQALISASGLSAAALTPYSTLFLGMAGILCGLATAHAAGGWKGLKQFVGPVLLLGLVMGLGQFLIAASGFWNISALGGSLAGLLVCFPLARRFGRIEEPASEKSGRPILDGRRITLALSGYVVLLVVILGVQLIGPVNKLLSWGTLTVNFPLLSTSQGWTTPAGPGRAIPFFRHTGTVLAYAAFFSYWIYRQAGRYPPGAARRILRRTFQSVITPSVGIVSMVAMAVIMEHAGMTQAIALGLSQGTGVLFPAVSPWIGALGAFMTGSNTNSNVVFSGLQQRTAELLGHLPAVILAAQTAGGSLGSVIAPTKIVVGTSTAGMAGQEGLVMRKLAGYIGLYILLISLLTFICTWFNAG